MAANHNSSGPHSAGPEGNYDPAGSTQMFRAFVEEAEPVRATVPGARRRRPAKAAPKTGMWIGLGLVGLLVIAAVAWLALG
ncbi:MULTISPECIES: hypothetical protein [unclassified Streptomyces]|uniref:hypothetical protein n=1 Tax=unclassified Streptomyces TaxID=2593676 RepID=UPI00109E719F|nr:hypothetical protein [Streptomyces sp. A1136]THA59350.1 hypothetical protein E6R62_01520 [Streptomyces sp. A1136]